MKTHELMKKVRKQAVPSEQIHIKDRYDRSERRALKHEIDSMYCLKCGAQEHADCICYDEPDFEQE